MSGSLDALLGLSNSGAIPLGQCFLWHPALVTASALSDGLIFISYAVIASALWHFARGRRDLRDHHRSYVLLLMVGAFVVSSGLTHLLHIWTIWRPDYWVATGVRALTAIASFGTAMLLWPLIPAALSLPGAQEMAELTAHLQVVREDEKRALAKRVHDELITGLTVVSMDLHNVQRRLEEEGNPLAENVRMVMRLLNANIEIKRNMLESLRPTILHELGIGAALTQLARNFSARTGIAHELAIDSTVRVPEDVGIALFRVAEEMLENVEQHAGATRVQLKLARHGPRLELLVDDNGQGWSRARGERREGYGLRGSRQMLARWHGTLVTELRAQGGTRVRAEITAHAPADASGSQHSADARGAQGGLA